MKKFKGTNSYYQTFNESVLQFILVIYTKRVKLRKYYTNQYA